MYFRVDVMSGQVKVASPHPFTTPAIDGEIDYEFDVNAPPTDASGRGNWVWCRVSPEGVMLDPTLIPPPVADGIKFHNGIVELFPGRTLAEKAEAAFGAFVRINTLTGGVWSFFDQTSNATPLSTTSRALLVPAWAKIKATNILPLRVTSAIEDHAISCGFSLTAR